MTSSVDELYPPDPSDVPEDLTRPSAAYQVSAWMAVAGVLGFVALYGLLVFWFGRLTYGLLVDGFSAGGDGFFGVLLAIPSGLLFFFLVRGLFRIQHQQDPLRVEITEAEQPRLFAFVRRIAREVGAPEPQRIVLSPRVNAAVFSDLSMLNLVLPAKKSLEIGLGLVNALTVDELKAVLAHEFGHFAQRSTAIGRWVYVAQQIVGHLVTARGKLDGLLEGLSHTDLRIAWIGWVLRLIVWSMRSVLDTAFRGLLLLQRALSKQMELQADLVAVSLAGSDSIVHGLYRANKADEAWDAAGSFAMAQVSRGREVPDFFALQSHVERRRAEIRGVEDELLPPRVPAEAPEAHRVFEAELAQPPRMWSTHPPNHEREANAKARYVPSSLVQTSSWALFDDVEQLRRDITRRLIEAQKSEDAEPEDAEATEAADAEDEDLFARLDRAFDRAHLDRRYRGAYLGRECTLGVGRRADLYATPTDQPAEVIRARLEALYPESLQDDLQHWRECAEQYGLLQALEDGILDAPGGVIRFRGRVIPRRQLGEVIVDVERERDQARAKVEAHDREVRSAHLAAARALGGGWDSYLERLVGLLHCLEHTHAELEDMHEYLGHVLEVVMADGNVSSSELRRLVAVSEDAHRVLERFFETSKGIRLSPSILERLEVGSWQDMLPDDRFDLPPPSQHNIGEGWLPAVSSWFEALTGALAAAKGATLETLVEAERQVADAFREGAALGDAPEAPAHPETYPTLPLGQERERQRRLGWWDRFQLADGWAPGALRLAVAGGVLGLTMLAGSFSRDVTTVAVNGLNIPVKVTIGEQTEQLLPQAHRRFRVAASDHLAVRATTVDGEQIEAFEVELSNAWKTHVYDVASAAPLVQWTAVYGAVREEPNRNLGNPRWSETRVDHVFEAPPRSISSSGSGGKRRVLEAPLDASPHAQVAFLPEPAMTAGLAAAHVRWDPVNHPDYLTWLAVGEEIPAVADAVAARRAAGDDAVALVRFEMDTADEAGRAELCASIRDRSEDRPTDPDLRYLAIRCEDEDATRDRLFVSAHREHPEHAWLALAAGVSLEEAGDPAGALAAYATALVKQPGLRSGLAVDIVRLLRVTQDRPVPDMGDFTEVTRQAPWLFQIMQIDAGVQPEEESFTPYVALQRGDFDEALRLAGAQRRPDMLRLVGASRGAPQAILREALALEDRPGDIGLAFALTVAAEAAGEDASKQRAQLAEASGPHAARTLRLLDPKLLGAPELADELEGLSTRWRGAVYAAACVRLGDAAPKAHCDKARRMLLAIERPYLGPEGARE